MSFIRPKYFIKKTNINLILSKPVLLKNKDEKSGFLYLNNNCLKICLSNFLQLLKLQKNLKSNIRSADSELGLKFQMNGVYSSPVELLKKSKISILRKKILALKAKKVVKNYFNKLSFISFIDTPSVKQKTIKSLFSGFEKFDLFYGDYSNSSEKRQVFLKILKTKRFFSKIFFSRLFFYTARDRKRYKNTFSYLVKRRRKINSLFHVYTLSSLKFRDIKKQRRRFFKRIVSKIKKQKRWKRYGSSVFFRLRQKLSQIFYVPKNFEINYKTLTASYLGYTDMKTTSTRIPFWLNLRKLLTFLS